MNNKEKNKNPRNFILYFQLSIGFYFLGSNKFFCTLNLNNIDQKNIKYLYKIKWDMHIGFVFYFRLN